MTLLTSSAGLIMAADEQVWFHQPATKRRTSAFAAIALLPCLLAIWVLWLSNLEVTGASRTALAARDFTALWTAGRLALDHAAELLPDPALFTAAIKQYFGLGMPNQVWPYPPLTLLLAAPLATLDLPVAFAIYVTASALLLWLALSQTKLDHTHRLLVLLSPACANCALAGQNGALLTAFVLAGLTKLRTAPMLAGVSLAISTLKPQFALLLPIALISGRHWLTLATMLFGTVALCAGSILCFGLGPWVDYLLKSHHAVWAILSEPWTGRSSQRIFLSAFMCARAIGADPAIAATVQAAITGLCAWLLWLVWRRAHVDLAVPTAFTLAVTLLASPWVHSYDEVMLACALALLAPRVPRWQIPILAVAWVLPGFILDPPPVTLQFAAVVAVAWIAWRNLARQTPCRHPQLPLCA